MNKPTSCRCLNIILGDQLNRTSIIFDGIDLTQDAFWMAEVKAASLQPPSHLQRSLLFISAMRHFAESLREDNMPLVYLTLDDGFEKFSGALTHSISQRKPQKIRCVLPGEYAVLQSIKQVCLTQNIPLEILPDNHFIALPGEFTHWAKGKTQWRMEYWYRSLRKRTGILMQGDKPLGGDWNFDKNNRGHFGKQGPGILEPALMFEMDDITRTAQQNIQQHFSKNPGNMDLFGWPVTREESLLLLDYFIEYQLPLFGEYQDAMWTHQPWLYHSRLSAALNLKLISPREVIARAESAYHKHCAPLNAVEGFIRQILGWREFVRGIYWSLMPGWLDMNALDAQQPLPDFYWTGDVDMHCLQQALNQVLQHGYGHHIQRLMVTGLFAQLWQTKSREIHEWYLAMYVDAVEWVELPNVLGMSQYADGGTMASKPYIATGRYISKMSNYCDHCQYQPDESDSENACPFTTLYWHFLERHKDRFAKHPRLGLQVKHLENMPPEKRAAISEKVVQLRKRYPSGHYS
jgi:deoxyribodipyrimidine photolyase-related protein